MAVLRLCLSTLKPNQAYLPTLVTNARVFLHQSPLLFICTKALSTRARTKDTVSVQDNTSDVERNPIQRISKGLDEKMPIGPDGPNLGQLSEPPVLFIGKYQRAIDTRELELRDELSDIAKKGKMTPESLTHQKVQYILEAVRQTSTIETLADRLRKEPEPLQAPPTATATERSVFVDSDFEVVRPVVRREAGRLQIKKFETELEWKAVKVEAGQLGNHYLMLSKSRLTLLVCLTAAAGYGMAPGPLSLSTCLIASLGTAMASAAANSINQILEVPFDSQMNRTKNRVLVRGHLSPLHAATFAAAMAGSSTLLLYLLVNPVTAALSFANLVLYTCIYTPMKRVSILNTWVGSVVGAVPPLIGWSAATGGLEPGAFVLAGILYAWQFPHFNSLSWNLRPDYSKAGYRMMSVTHPGLCKRVALRHSVGCIAICTAAPLLDVTTWAFAIDSLPLNLYMTYLSWKFHQKADSSSSRKLFRFSLIHLPLLMMLMCISKKSDNDREKEPIPKI